MGKAPAGELLNFSPNTITGILRTFSIPGVVESFYSFVVGEEKILPVVLKQIYRSEDSLALMQGSEVTVDGTMRFTVFHALKLPG